ncbi:MAG: hypothetical protein Q4G71_16730 [Pseudomonadota bacterium]|nr:hypothetical protein [Pseudomonadota bacterium]
MSSAENTAIETPAAGVSGVLCRSWDEQGRPACFFRVTQVDGSFKDYRLRHDDLSVTIASDELASFYETVDGDGWLDHPSSVLRGW